MDILYVAQYIEPEVNLRTFGLCISAYLISH